MCYDAHNTLRFLRGDHEYGFYKPTIMGCLNDADTGLQRRKSSLRIMRSEFYWFTEICNSQCLSHFAASFIVSRAEESTVKGRFWVCYQLLIRTLHSSQLSFDWFWVCLHYWLNINLFAQVKRLFPLKWIELCAATNCLCSRCEWSFRRFTYGSLVTTCPSSKW